MLEPIEIPSRSGAVPIRFFLSETMLPDDQTRHQLQRLAAAEGLVSHVAVLPDIHRKHRNISPTGTAVATRNTLLPRAVDTGICCGMRMFKIGIPAREMSPERLDRLFAQIQKTVPVLFHEEDVLSKEEVLDVLLHGGRWAIQRFGLPESELEFIEDGGVFLTDAPSVERLVAAMPKKSLKKGRKCFGTIGDGNHFLELQEIVDILDFEAARWLGLEKGHTMFMLHTGSRSVGSKMMKHYLKEFESQLGMNGEHIWAVNADSEMGRNYVLAIAAACNFGFANRMAITEQVRAAVRAVFADDSLKLPLLYDCAHVSIKHERWNGDRVWVHRHGASRALPASQMADHPVFARTGQPVPIPGSMGHDSYIGVADVGAERTFFSVNHGAGRVLDKPEAVRQYTEADVEQEMRRKNIRLYRYGSDNIAEQAPGSFKNISQVLEAMQALQLARPVVRLRPLAVLKG
ncbi:MAG: RtcB family protein [candidate division KSB1 bacterium]|nr:RtcB family protein [candidate division KSB1 bacterium]